MDKRNIRSKSAIKQGLINLASERPYIEITVQDLCKAAKVSRSTFYNNYHSLSDVVAEICSEYMGKIRGKHLSYDFFNTLTRDGDELKLLIETGDFGREFSFYLKELIAGELKNVKKRTADDVILNVKALYHAYGIFGVLQNLAKTYGTPFYNDLRDKTIDTLLELAGRLSEDIGHNP